MSEYEVIRLKAFYQANPDLYADKLHSEIKRMVWAIIESAFVLAGGNVAEAKEIIRKSFDFSGIENEPVVAELKEEINRLYQRRVDLIKKYPTFNAYAEPNK